MAQTMRCASVAWTLVLLALAGCGPSDDGDARHLHQAAALADQEDEVCGMLVRAQSAPRGQVVHRDGSRFFFCSLGDLLVHLGAPSPHGRTVAVFVEVMNPDENPMASHLDQHPWVLAEDAFYVIGIERQGIMGEPVLAYAERGAAESAAQGHTDARVLDLGGLRDWWKELEAAR
jgi:nitrous oxide reductase accessory protein NosL